MAADRIPRASTAKRGGYPAGTKPVSQMKRPPASISRPKDREPQDDQLQHGQLRHGTPQHEAC
jgi:hypothetical protein